jgi:type 2A phosphatase activator TIP41
MATRAPWAAGGANVPSAPPQQPDPAVLAALRARGGELLPDQRGVRVQGWRVEATQRPIMGRDDLHRCVRALAFARTAADAPVACSAEESLDARGLPEMLFGSTLELKHEASGVALSFNALDALREWKARGMRTVAPARCCVVAPC